jgi:hypothetical protein
MAPLHAAVAHATSGYLNAKRSADHLRDWQFFLILHGDLRPTDRPTTVWAVGRQPRVVPFIDPARAATTRLATVLRAGLAPWPTGMGGESFRERRRLPVCGALGLVQLTFEPLDLSAQPFILALQPISLMLGALCPLAQVIDVARARLLAAGRLLRHAEFMADS